MKRIAIDDIDFNKCAGLVPVIVQDSQTKEILTLAYANKEALQLTIDQGFAYFYRRSHGMVMMKGVTSGNVQLVVEILADCDADAVVYLVNPRGPACHRGDRSCFHYTL
ncbi:MAG: phosphoribosyl-AMP cyclohydrolase [Candidatus Thorarchaeota archaeon]